MKAVITEDLGNIVFAEVDGKTYRIDFDSNVPGWGVWRRRYPYPPDVDAARKWLDTLRALDHALDVHYGKKPA